MFLPLRSNNFCRTTLRLKWMRCNLSIVNLMQLYIIAADANTDNTANTWHYQLSALVLQLRPEDARPRLSAPTKFLVPDTTLNLMPSMAGA